MNKVNRKFLFKLGIILILIWISTRLILNSSYSQNYESQSHVLDSFKSKIQRKKYNISCRSILEMDPLEMKRAKILLSSVKTVINKKNKVKLLPDSNFHFESEKCSQLKTIRGYDRYELSEIEKNLPLAYTILTYNNVEQFERFLRLIYRQNNIYCIHIDTKSSNKVKKAIRSIANCFDNVFIATKLEYVVYASYSRLQADLNCMSDLLNLDRLINKDRHENLIGKRVIEWKYLLNTASSEFPLRTNYELAKILTMYNGSNEIEIIKHISPDRIKYSWKTTNNSQVPQMTNKTKSDPPHGYKIVKGYAYGAFARKFVSYALVDNRAQDLINWSMDTWSPDEW
jgi:hypothetical protein